MRLLLTRSAVDAARTREKLEAMGHRVLVSPVIDTVATGAAVPAGVVDALLATSAQAFAVPLEALAPEARRLMPLLLVGERTATAAAAAGFAGATIVAPNAAALAKAIGRLAHPPRRIVYLAGRVRKPDLETALAKRGQAVDTVEIYDAQPLNALSPEAADALARNAIDGVLHFSRRSAELFLSIAAAAGVDVSRPAHLCLSEDVAEPLRDASCRTIEVAVSPNEADLLALVRPGAVEGRPA